MSEGATGILSRIRELEPALDLGNLVLHVVNMLRGGTNDGAEGQATATRDNNPTIADAIKAVSETVGNLTPHFATDHDEVMKTKIIIGLEEEDRLNLDLFLGVLMQNHLSWYIGLHSHLYALHKSWAQGNKEGDDPSRVVVNDICQMVREERKNHGSVKSTINRCRVRGYFETSGSLSLRAKMSFLSDHTRPSVDKALTARQTEEDAWKKAGIRKKMLHILFGTKLS